jgi:putative ABC transport system ATP-binding protein
MASHLPLIEARGLGRRVPAADAWLLRDIDFRLHAGSRIALAGPSGSGKTLLLRALAGLDPAQHGRLLWNGRELHGRGLPRYRSQVVYLHQRPAFVQATVQAELRFPFSLHTHRHRQFDAGQVKAWLEALGRDEMLLERPCADLSGGERQMVALMRAMQLDPQALLLDEPTAALDSDTVDAVERLVSGWFQAKPRSRAYIWVTHDASQSARLCDRVVRLRAGRLE